MFTPKIGLEFVAIYTGTNLNVTPQPGDPQLRLLRLPRPGHLGVHLQPQRRPHGRHDSAGEKYAKYTFTGEIS